MTEGPAKTDRAAALEREAQATIASYRAYLDSPAFEHSVDLLVLVKIAGDENADIRERRRAAEVLAKLRLQAMEGLASLVGAREQALDSLGLKTGSPTLALTQVNQRIEIVRAKDWRNAMPVEAVEAVEAEVLPEPGHPRLSGQEANDTTGSEPTGEVNGHAADPAS